MGKIKICMESMKVYVFIILPFTSLFIKWVAHTCNDLFLSY
jgi:hypothetical protein